MTPAEVGAAGSLSYPARYPLFQVRLPAIAVIFSIKIAHIRKKTRTGRNHTRINEIPGRMKKR
jgi:hypothetical protein